MRTGRLKSLCLRIRRMTTRLTSFRRHRAEIKYGSGPERARRKVKAYQWPRTASIMRFALPIHARSATLISGTFVVFVTRVAKTFGSGQRKRTDFPAAIGQLFSVRGFT